MPAANCRESDRSLSLRRAWIEIGAIAVDGNVGPGRSPYGERGLKYVPADGRVTKGHVALLTESVD